MKEFLIHIFILVLSVLQYLDYNDAQELKQRIYILEHTKLTEPKAVNTFGELSDIKPEHRAIVMAIAMTESSCNYNVKHPDKDTKGIGGIKQSQWTLKSNINSLKAIEEVVEVLEKKYSNKYTIIRKYKGGVTNLKSTQQCWDLYLRLENIL
jgi:hypothetical protein